MVKKEDWSIIRPWVLFACICCALGVIVIKFDHIFMFIARFIGLLTPLFYALVIAFIINIPMKHIERKIVEYFPRIEGKKYLRAISIVSSFILVITIVSVIVMLLAPQIYDSIGGLVVNISGIIDNVEDFFNGLLTSAGIDYQITLDTIFSMPWEDLFNNIQAYINTFINQFIKNARGFSGTIGNLFVGFMLSLYLLSGKEGFLVGLKKALYAVFGTKLSKQILRIGRLSNDIFEHFISGQLIEMFILAGIFYIGLSIFRIPYALLISVITGISGIIPIFGAIVAMTFGCILVLGYTMKISQVVLFIILFQVIQQFENNVIYPRVVGSSVGLPGIFVLMSIIVFGDLFGAVGMIIAVPSMAVIYSLASEFVNERLAAMPELTDETK
ncbi:MAG: AI-2E family transporter [Erysipelotrichales bacterium]|nr:AI-2E family transporter [Erysipelotrichales bacterium]